LNNTPGNFLIVSGTAARPAATISISDTAGNVYLPAIGPVTDTVQDVTAYIWYVPNCKGGANTVTLTPSTADALEIHISEWSGLASTSPLDQTASASGSGTNVSSGPASTTANGELIYGYAFLFNNATAGAGFTAMSIENGDLDEYQVQTTAGSVAATFTQTTGTWFALMATFKSSGAVSNPPVLSVTPATLAFYATQGGGNPPASTVSVANTGGGAINFSTGSDSSWLTVSPTMGTAPEQLQISASLTGLSVGTYTGHVTITDPGVQGSPATVTVTLNIGVATDWLMVDHDPSRSGNAVDETILTTANVSSLQLSWSTTVDGNVTAQPLYVHAIEISGQTRDVLVVGTGGNTIYVMDASNGSVLWNRNFGAPTPNTWGLPDGFGIEAPPVVDRVAGRIYTVSTDGVFRTISLFDGTDVYPGLTLIANPVTNKVWGGLNKVGNSIYIASASNGGDVAPWRGQIYQIDVSGTPTLVGDFVVVPSIPAPNGGGGIWGYGGVSADIVSGTIYAATATDSVVDSNGNEGYAPYSDSLLALSAQLNLLGYYQPVQPPTFPCDGAPCDLDFASTPIYFQPAGCAPMVAAGNKNGNLYLIRTSDLIASGQPLQILSLNGPNDDIGNGAVAGVPAYYPGTNMLYVTDVGPGVTGVAAGVIALKVTSSCNLQVAWSTTLGGSDMPNSTPTVANGIVFAGEGSTGAVHAYDAQTGTQLWQSSSQYPAGATFAAPTVAGGKVYAGSWASVNGGGVVGAFSLAASGPVLSVSPNTLSFTATSGGSNPQPAPINVANSGTGTLTFTAGSDSAWLTVLPLGGTAPQALQATVSIMGLGPGTYTGHVTVTAAGAQNSPSVVTVTLSISSSGGGNVTIDATVSGDNGSAATSITTPSFSTTSANELLLAFVATDSLSSNMTVTGITGAGLTWSLVQRTNTQGGTAEIWRAFAATTLSDVTVTANLSQKVVSSITVMSFAGVDATGSGGSGAIGATASANAASGAPTGSLTTTRNNSWVLGVGNDYDKAVARTVGANQVLVHQYLSATGDTYWVQRQNAPTPVSGTKVTINDTAPTGDRYNLSLVEVLPGS
jgi:hypothetical protein